MKRLEEPFRQKKSLGQVFLTTDWPVARMIEKLQELRVERCLEIGPGPGILTKGLVHAGLRVTAVEKDERWAQRLIENAATLSPDLRGNLTIIRDDILTYDWQEWIRTGTGRAAIVGNIPYNISTPILLRGINHMQDVALMMFMTQLEFAARAVAPSGNKDYGSLSVFLQLRADCHLEFKVPRTVFSPVPKVDSAVLSLVPKRDRPPEALLQHAEQVTRMAFMQRRKKLRNSIRQLLDNAGGEDACPIDLERRADSLAPREFVELAEFLFGD
jgi:16S rRNA (adenine1518-N6/adenine1519-N6)-dimethyltransferase